MTVQIPTRFQADEARSIDELVEQGVAESRSDLVRLAVRSLIDQKRRSAIAEAIIDSYTKQPQSDDEAGWALANAIAVTEAEPW